MSQTQHGRCQSEFLSFPFPSNHHYKFEFLIKGLDEDVAAKRLEENGPNALTPPETISDLMRFLQNMFGWFNILLWTGSLLCFAAFSIEVYTIENPAYDNLYLGIVLATVVFISGLFSYYQESKSANIMESFRNMIPTTTTVVRNGKKRIIPVEDLVLGDVVEVKGGDQVPADIRIIKSSRLKVDNSSLTGESDPLLRTVECTNANPMETKNLAFFSTNCIEGAGMGIVVRTGDTTMMGTIANLASGVETEETPLSKDINSFINLITIVAVIFGGSFAIISYVLGYTLLQSSVFLISLIVANVPEGLLPTVTVALTLTAKRMSAKNCLVKNLQSVETLGSTSVICTDKTGTLTQNRMTVSHFWINQGIVDAENLDRQKDHTKAELTSKVWDHVIRTCCLCSRAEFVTGRSIWDQKLPTEKATAIGDASEVAILKYMEAVTGSVSSYRSKYPKVYEVPFNSTNKYHITINESLSEHGYWLSMKGAPERIIDLCSSIIVEYKEVQLDGKLRNEFLNAYNQLGSLGERVIGLAELFIPFDSKFTRDYKFDADEKNFPLSNLRFLGLVSMIDPPRPSVPDAVSKCRSAGIKGKIRSADRQESRVRLEVQIGRNQG